MMRRLRLIARIIAGGATALPLLLHAHNGEFLEARFARQQDVLHVRIIADHGDNPMIADEDEARKALTDALRIEVGASKSQHRLEELAPLDITKNAHRHPKSPVPGSEGHPEHHHHLMAATWKWSAPAGEVRFLVPETSRHTVLFWLDEPGVSPPRWSMLVPGDYTPVISIQRPAWKNPWLWSTALVAGLGAAAFVSQRLRRQARRSEDTECGT